MGVHLAEICIDPLFCSFPMHHFFFFSFSIPDSYFLLKQKQL